MHLETQSKARTRVASTTEANLTHETACAGAHSLSSELFKLAARVGWQQYVSPGAGLMAEEKPSTVPKPQASLWFSFSPICLQVRQAEPQLYLHFPSTTSRLFLSIDLLQSSGQSALSIRLSFPRYTVVLAGCARIGLYHFILIACPALTLPELLVGSGFCFFWLTRNLPGTKCSRHNSTETG